MLDYKEGIINALWLIGWLRHPKLDGTAVPCFEESINLARETGYTWGAMHAYAWYGMYLIGIGDYEAAKPALREGIVQAERIGGNSSLIGRCREDLGQAALLQGDFVAAKTSLDKSLALTKGRGKSQWNCRNPFGCKADWRCARTTLRRHSTISRRKCSFTGPTRLRCG